MPPAEPAKGSHLPWQPAMLGPAQESIVFVRYGLLTTVELCWASSASSPCAESVLANAAWPWGELGCWQALTGRGTAGAAILPVVATGEADHVAGRGGFVQQQKVQTKAPTCGLLRAWWAMQEQLPQPSGCRCRPADGD